VSLLGRRTTRAERKGIKSKEKKISDEESNSISPESHQLFFFLPSLFPDSDSMLTLHTGEEGRAKKRFQWHYFQSNPTRKLLKLIFSASFASTETALVILFVEPRPWSESRRASERFSKEKSYFYLIDFSSAFLLIHSHTSPFPCNST
jgi:hypothetical protein